MPIRPDIAPAKKPRFCSIMLLTALRRASSWAGEYLRAFSALASLLPAMMSYSQMLNKGPTNASLLGRCPLTNCQISARSKSCVRA
eukprot:scaffold666904_cov48-Prasinocladus_malaysianus.AAC.2